jgi:hypothetical protein
MKLEKYLTEAKINFKVKKDKEGFYNNPGMVGHNLAKETVDTLETLFNKVVKTKKQKILMNLLVDFEETDWHYFYNKTKKDIQMYSYILRRVDKQSPYELLLWYNNKSGMWKDKLAHILEYLSYMSADKEEYLKRYSSNLGFYGMASDEAKERFEGYHKLLLKKYSYIKEIKRKWK